MSIASTPPNVPTHPDTPIEPIPAVLTAADIARILRVSEPTSYAILHACKPISIGRRIKRVLAEDFKAWLEAQR